MLTLPNQYRTEVRGTTSTGSLLSAALDFSANYVRVANGGTVPLRATFNSTVASTNDAEVRPGEVLEWQSGPTYKIGIMTTSTSTDGTDHRRVRVLALGD